MLNKYFWLSVLLGNLQHVKKASKKWNEELRQKTSMWMTSFCWTEKNKESFFPFFIATFLTHFSIKY